MKNIIMKRLAHFTYFLIVLVSSETRPSKQTKRQQ
jgi:hypothetical protein